MRVGVEGRSTGPEEPPGDGADLGLRRPIVLGLFGLLFQLRLLLPPLLLLDFLPFLLLSLFQLLALLFLLFLELLMLLSLLLILRLLMAPLSFLLVPLLHPTALQLLSLKQHLLLLLVPPAHLLLGRALFLAIGLPLRAGLLIPRRAARSH